MEPKVRKRQRHPHPHHRKCVEEGNVELRFFFNFFFIFVVESAGSNICNSILGILIYFYVLDATAATEEDGESKTESEALQHHQRHEINGKHNAGTESAETAQMHHHQQQQHHEEEGTEASRRRKKRTANNIDDANPEKEPFGASAIDGVNIVYLGQFLCVNGLEQFGNCKTGEHHHHHQHEQLKVSEEEDGAASSTIRPIRAIGLAHRARSQSGQKSQQQVWGERKGRGRR